MKKSLLSIPALLLSACLFPTNDPEVVKCQVRDTETAKTNLSTKLMSTSIETPANWPSQEMQLGFVMASIQDWEAIDANAGDLDTYQAYRFMDLTWMTESMAAGAITEMVEQADTRPMSPGVVMQLFYDGNIATASQGDRKDALLRKMNNATQVAQYFNILKTMSESINAVSDKKQTVVLEPDVWGYLIQARFSLASESAAPALEAGLEGDDALYANMLDFPAKVNYADLVASGIDAWYADKLVGYTDDVKGLGRAMLAMAKELMPNATIANSLHTWAIYADACSNSGQSTQDGNSLVSGLIDVEGVNGLVTWSDDDIQLAAFSYVKFLRDLYGWDDDYNSANWPDAFTTERGGLDAGLIWKGLSQSYVQAHDPGAGTPYFFWNQGQYDKWLDWNKKISHGTQIPMIAINVPVGNGSNSANVAFNYQDTFMDWLFGDGTSGNWGDQALPSTGSVPTWDAGNFAKFKEAGFIGMWVGAVGWPAVGTHYGTRSSNASKGGPSQSMTGDNGWAIQQFSAQDRSFTSVSVDFNESHFADYSGFCNAGKPGTEQNNFNDFEPIEILPEDQDDSQEPEEIPYCDEV